MKKFLLFMFFVLIISFISVSQAIATGDVISPEKIREKEQKITENISEQVEKQIPRVRDPELEKKLSEVAERIKPQMVRDLNYEVRIIKRNDPHAFSLPGGLTYITTGMLDFLKSEDEIAAVLSREFTHSDLSHWIIQSSRNEKIDFQTMAELAAATQSGKVAGNMVRSYLNRAVINFYDLDLEKETDTKALGVIEKAKYNNVALLTFLERMNVERLKQIYVRGIDIRYKSGFKPLETIMGTMKFLKKKDDKKSADPVQTDMIQANTDMEERVEVLLKYFKDKNRVIRRKDVVNVLRISMTEVSGMLGLNIDRTEVMSAEKNYRTENMFEFLKSRLDRDLQLETAPYDIQVQNILGTKALLIAGRPLLYERDLSDGMADLSNIRARIIKALIDARRENFLTDYYE
ncbi:MAG: M48 family metalloprotease [Synergistaceae bacterium]|nr:M48 family metalloprotease [Synergistaceae bacterium]